MNAGYFQMPKLLFGEKYASVDANGKILYMFLLDRRRLSENNGYMDDLGVYCFMSRNEMAEITQTSPTSVRKYLKQLSDIGLIFERRIGQGRQNKIYVLFPADQDSDLQKNNNKQSNIDGKSDLHTESSDCCGQDGEKVVLHNNNNNNKNNHKNNKDISISKAEKMLKNHFGYDQYFAGTIKADMAETMIGVMADVFASQKQSIRIHKVETDIETVKSQLMKLEPAHLDYTIDQILKSKNKINGSGAAYMLTCLYDAYANYNLYFNKTYCSKYA